MSEEKVEKKRSRGDGEGYESDEGYERDNKTACFDYTVVHIGCIYALVMYAMGSQIQSQSRKRIRGINWNEAVQDAVADELDFLACAPLNAKKNELEKILMLDDSQCLTYLKQIGWFLHMQVCHFEEKSIFLVNDIHGQGFEYVETVFKKVFMNIKRDCNKYKIIPIFTLSAGLIGTERLRSCIHEFQSYYTHVDLDEYMLRHLDGFSNKALVIEDIANRKAASREAVSAEGKDIPVELFDGLIELSMELGNISLEEDA